MLLPWWKVFCVLSCFFLPAKGYARTSSSSDRLYKLLDLPKSATSKEISRAYRRLAVKWHPDKNLNNKEEAEQKFKEITEAYEILSNPEKRKAYDQFGEAGLGGVGGQPPWGEPQWGGPGGGGGGMDFDAAFGGRGGPQAGGFGFTSAFGSSFSDFMSDYFNQRWGAGMGGPSTGRRGGRSTGAGNEQIVDLECTLEDLYKGRVKRVPVSVVLMDMWSGMPKTRDKTFTVSISKGWKAGTKIRYGPAADGFPPVTFILREAPHAYLTRRDADLVWRRDITKEQATRNLILKIPCLDGTIERVRVAAGSVTKHVYVHRVKGRGMPNKKGGYGDLVIELNVKRGERR